MTAVAGAIREVSQSDLADWDSLAVDRPGGHVFQSRAFGEFQATLGWRVRWLRFDDGFPVLVLQRRWPWIGGASAYVPRGPVPIDSPEVTASRLVALAGWLAARGVAVIAADPEVEAATAFGSQVRAAGFRPIEELQPSRHRMRIPLTARSEDDILRGATKSTRQRIRHAEESGVAIQKIEAPPGRQPLLAFYDLLRETGDRRGFSFGSRDEFVGWWEAALAARFLVYLLARTADGTAIAGLLLYRHGGRLSTVHSADLVTARRDHPGVLHLLRWRAIQLALASGCGEMDFGGVDVVGARRIPRSGELLFGLFEHKRSFGAEWVELTGAHEFVADRIRYTAGRVIQRLDRVVSARVPGRGA